MGVRRRTACCSGRTHTGNTTHLCIVLRTATALPRRVLLRSVIGTIPEELNCPMSYPIIVWLGVFAVHFITSKDPRQGSSQGIRSLLVFLPARLAAVSVQLYPPSLADRSGRTP